MGVGMLWSQSIPQKKYEDRAVQDYVGLLSAHEQDLLNAKLTHYADSTSTGIVIAIMADVEDDINFQAAQMLSKWGVGQKGKDNGVLLLMAVNQRKIAISTGYGVEERLTDARSRRIIQNDIIPQFRNENYYAGFDQGTTAIMNVLSGAFTQDKESQSTGFSGIFLFFAVILGVIILLSVLKGRGKGNGGDRFGGGFDLSDFIILTSMGRSSSGGFGGFGGGSSGGFGGFGGGMGGGGGASGSW
ncbi:MAG: TPM domain-containing protein [Capnocytophaga sp.]|nr:TPM domain-containing protein [Capnocytophaga sp.]